MYEALQAGAEADAIPEQAPDAGPGSPEGESDTTSTADVQPVTPVAPEVQNTDLFDGTPINPDELPAELQPLAKQLQAAFTQKTQALAAERAQFEELGSVEDLQQALALTERITDPANWQQLHQELTAAMEEHGMTPAEAHQAAAEALGAAAQSPAALDLDSIEDPDLAPLAQMLKAQQAELDSLKQAREAEQMNQQAEYERQAFLGELQRQENAIRAAHPDWDDDRILAVYKMSSFYGGNLNEAANDLNALLHAERELYLGQKAAATQETGRTVPPRGAGTQSQQVQEPQTLKDAEDEAIEFFKARVDHYDNA